MRDKWSDENQEQYINNLLILDEMRDIIRNNPLITVKGIIEEVDFDIDNDFDIFTELTKVTKKLNNIHGKSKKRRARK